MTTGDGSEATWSGSSAPCEETAPAQWLQDPPSGVTVVLCAYTEQRWPQIVRAVSSVLRQSRPPDQIILVVDHNTALLHRARAGLPKVDVVASAGPPGLSGARNTGVALSRGEIIAFLDDDAEAEPDWLATLLPHYRDPRVVAVGGHVEALWEQNRPQWLPSEFDWVVGCSFTGLPVRTAPVRNTIGANMTFRRSALERINRFNPALGRIGRTPVGCEETELCIRVQQAFPDGVVLYEPRARVRHQVSADRATWRYFRRRCFAEGLSKAVVAGLVGSDMALSTERTYVRRTLPHGFLRGLREASRGDRAGLVRSAAIVAGLLFTASGYALGYARRLRTVRTDTSPAALSRPAPIRVLDVELGEGMPDLPDVTPDGKHYGSGQVLVRLHGQPLGLVHVDIPPGGLAAQALATAISSHLAARIAGHLRDDGVADPTQVSLAELGTVCPTRAERSSASPFVTVVVPTCGRAQMLARTLDSLARLDYDRLEVVVVDNAPHVPGTTELVAWHAARDARIRYVAEPRRGVTHARSRGLAEARGEIVAFVDDDVTVDRQWLRALVDGFTDEDVAAVTGPILAAELDNPVQIWTEQYGGFSKGFERKRFERSGFEYHSGGVVHRVPAEPRSLYPYLPGCFGSGANMAFRTKVARTLGGFDPLLGSGTAIRAGEDIDLLMRVVLAGHALVYEPAAIVWHTHRGDEKALRRAVYQYGLGLSATMAKCLAADRVGRQELVRRIPHGLVYALSPKSAKNSGKKAGYPASLTALELCGMAVGPAYYAAARLLARTRRHGSTQERGEL